MCAGKGFCLKQEHQTSSQARLGIQAAILLLSLGAIAGAVLSLIGADKVVTTINDLVDVTVKEKGLGQLQEYLDRLQEMANDALAVAGDLSDGASSDLSDLKNLESTIQEIRGEVDSVADIIELSDEYVEVALRAVKIVSYVIASLIMVLVLFGALAAVLSNSKMLLCPLINAPLWLIFAWALFTAFNVLHVIMDSACR